MLDNTLLSIGSRTTEMIRQEIVPIILEAAASALMPLVNYNRWLLAGDLNKSRILQCTTILLHPSAWSWTRVIV